MVGIIGAAIIVLLAYGYYRANFKISIGSYHLLCEKIPAGIRILQISDFHNKRFGYKQHALIDKVKSLSPDIIVFTGDLLNVHMLSTKPSRELIEGLQPHFPIYYIRGNHEEKSRKYNAFEKFIKESRVRLLINSCINLGNEKNNTNWKSIRIVGIDDCEFFAEGRWEKKLKDLGGCVRNDCFTILLSHRPEFLKLYAELSFDLVLSGHAHGGQFRFPGIRPGFYSPDQGLLPKYVSGLFRERSTSMIVSRGIGGPALLSRVFNRPEMILVKIY